MVAIERYNAPQKVLAEGLRPPSTHKQRLGKLLDLVGTIGLGDAENPSEHILGCVCEYFLTESASAEGKEGSSTRRTAWSAC